jgi:hypothetical protein
VPQVHSFADTTDHDLRNIGLPKVHWSMAHGIQLPVQPDKRLSGR